MKRNIIRSTLFNIAFILVNAICCFLWLPTLLLPRKTYMKAIDVYHYIMLGLEYFILGLRYEIIGQEHIPKDGAYIVAAKHMSTYETFKLHLLFNDPAIILKKELLNIPLWGQFLKKTGVIAIDRSTPEKANESIKAGALNIKDQGRPIIIFPQGTRVWPHDTSKTKRYKSGIYRIQKAIDLPIIPMATNSGSFWPRSGWLKSSGTVTFKCLPAIPTGKTKDRLIKQLENTIETESNALMDQALADNQNQKRGIALLPIALIILALLGAAYSHIWYKTADTMKAEYITFMSNMGRTGIIQEPQITGFPGPIRLNILEEEFERAEFTLNIKIIELQTWPMPFTPITLRTGPISIGTVQWKDALSFDSFAANFTPKEHIIDIHDSLLRTGALNAQITGQIDLDQKPIPALDTLITVRGFDGFFKELADKNIIPAQMSAFLSFGFNNLKREDGSVRVPLTQYDDKIYAGPLPVFDLPETFSQSDFLE